MEGRYPYNQDATDFIFAGAGNTPRFTTNSLNIRMGWMLMTHRYNASRRLVQRVSQVWWKRVSNYYSLTALNPEARMAQPSNIHTLNIAYLSLTVKEKDWESRTCTGYEILSAGLTSQLFIQSASKPALSPGETFLHHERKPKTCSFS